MKIGIIGDYHLGLKQDSDAYHNTALDCCDWMIAQFLEQKVKTVISTGDIFHHRNEINNKTLNVANQFFERLVKHFDVHVITGNHDCFYRDNSTINSLKVFDGKTDGKNRISVYDETRKVNFGGTSIGFYPWGADIATETESCDVAIGHFEIYGFKMNGHKVCEGHTTPEQIARLSKLVLSGHFHGKQQKVVNGSEIIYVGTPYEMDWSDYGSKKGVHILDTKNLKLSFLENTVSPRHVLIDLTASAISSDGFNNAKNNIVRVIADSPLNENNSLLLKDCFAWDVHTKNREKEHTVELRDAVLDNHQLLDQYVESLNIEDAEIKTFVSARIEQFKNL